MEQPAPSQNCIAFIDDDPFILAAMQRTTRGLAFDRDFTFSHDAQAFLEASDHHPPDAIISDSQMPGISGWQLLAQASAKFPTSVRIISSASPPRLQNVLSFAAHQCWLKPCNPRRLMELLHDLRAIREQLPPDVSAQLTYTSAPSLLPSTISSLRNGNASTAERTLCEQIMSQDLGAALLMCRITSQLAPERTDQHPSANRFSPAEIVNQFGADEIWNVLQHVFRSNLQAEAFPSQTDVARDWEQSVRNGNRWNDPVVHALVGKWFGSQLGTSHTATPERIGQFICRLWRIGA